MTRIKGLSARRKSCPGTSPLGNAFLSSLFSRAAPSSLDTGLLPLRAIAIFFAQIFCPNAFSFVAILIPDRPDPPNGFTKSMEIRAIPWLKCRRGASVCRTLVRLQRDFGFPDRPPGRQGRAQIHRSDNPEAELQTTAMRGFASKQCGADL